MPRYIPLKLLYFFQAAGGASILPFLSLILKQLGVTGAGFGFGLALIGITGIIARPFTTSLIDKYQRSRVFCFRLLIFGAVIGFGLISQVPSVKEKESRPNMLVYGCETTNSPNDKMFLVNTKGTEDVCTLEKLRELKSDPITCDFTCENQSGELIYNFLGEINMSTVTSTPIKEAHEQSKESKSQSTKGNDDVFIFETSISCQYINSPNCGALGSVCDRNDLVKLSRCGLNCPDDVEITNMLMLKDSTSLFTNARYWLLILCWMMGAICISSIGPIQDTFCHQILKKETKEIESKEVKGKSMSSKQLTEPKKETFGQQRLFASLGWGSCAFISGYMIKNASETSILNNYNPSFLIMAFLWIMATYNAGRLGLEEENIERKESSAMNNDQNLSSENSNITRNIKETLTNFFSKPRYTIFLVYAMVAGSCLGCMNIHFLLLDELGQQGDCDALKAIKFVQGLCIAIQCTGELPIFRFSGRLLDQLGTEAVSYIVLLAYLIRFTWYGVYMSSPWQTVYVEPIHGLCIGLFFPLLTSQAMSIAKDLKKKDKGKETTIMGLVYSAHDLGVALGGWACGFAYEKYGAAITFQCMSYFVLFVLCLHVLSKRMLK